ncbi:MAG: hypothetical protein QOJ65_658 [Fimbriimonadaceae bacterium]|jgi:SAM-dependent methyltransferase|nr:hypothetical protein [Fimbriimonadaceae bacterium]
MKPLPEASYLDPRLSADAADNPIANSVNIPLEEFASRTAELPPKHETIQVAGPEDLTERTVQWLADHGRKAASASNYVHTEHHQNARLWAPNPWLETVLPNLKPGAALDLGSGAGREAVYMAAHGWHVTAVDNLPECATRGRDLAARYLEPQPLSCVDWQTADVLNPAYDPDRSFDLVTCFFFFDRDLVARAIEWLAPGGSIVIEAFTTKHQEREGKPASAERVVNLGGLPDLLREMQVVQYDEGDHDHGHTARIWARRV